MKIAAPIGCFLEQADNDLLKAVSLIKEKGFKAAEIDTVGFSLETLNSFAQQLIDVGLEYTMHSNYVDTNIASSNEVIRRASIDLLKEEILFAEKIGCKIITLHAGKFRNRYHEEEAYELFYNTMDEVLPFAKEHNVVLSVENIEDTERRLALNPERMKIILDKYPDLMMTLDAAHAIINNENPVWLYSLFKDRIKMVHISGVMYRRSHVEVSLKESEYDFSEFFQKIKNEDVFVKVENRELSKMLESVDFINECLGEK
jgi:sugar phosphate isomerase/epimerase